MGPLIREAQRERVERYVATGITEGARLAFGGGRPADLHAGFFVEPTLFADVDNSMTVAQEEIFGPVGVVIPFEGEEEAVSDRQRQPVRAGGDDLAPEADARVRARASSSASER